MDDSQVTVADEARKEKRNQAEGTQSTAPRAKIKRLIREMSSAIHYVPNASQRREIATLIRDGIQMNELSLMILVRGGANDTRRVLTDAIMSAIANKHPCSDLPMQVVYFCNSGDIIAGTRGVIYISASGYSHICSEACLTFLKDKGHPVLHIDCGRMQTETEILQAALTDGGIDRLILQ